MSDKTQPDGTVERTPAPEFQPTDRYKELSAAMSALAKSADGMGEKLENMQKIQAEMAKEREKMRPVNAPERSIKTIDDVIATKALSSEDKYIQELNDRAIDRAIVRACKAQAVASGTDVNLKRIPREVWDTIPEVQEIRTKASGSWWDTTTGNSLDEWVPVQISQQAIPFYTVDYDLPSLFDQVTIPRGVESVSVPVETSRAYAVIEPQTTGTTANFMNAAIANTATGDVCTLAPKKMSNAHAMSMEAVEDVAVDLLARARENSARAVRAGIGEAMISGQDTDDATLDDAPAASGLYSANGWSTADGANGLRLHCIVGSGGAFTTNAAGAAADSADIISLMSSIGKYGAKPEELVYLTSPSGAIGMLSDTAVKTLDTYGTQATIFTGELGRVVGVPVVATSEFPQDMDLNGINAGTGALTGGILVNRKRWLFGTARNLEQTFVPHPGYDAAWVVTRMRADFKTAVIAEHNAHYLINVAV